MKEEKNYRKTVFFNDYCFYWVGGGSHLLVSSLNVCDGCAWNMPKQESGMQSRSPLWMAGTRLLQPCLLAP